MQDLGLEHPEAKSRTALGFKVQEAIRKGQDGRGSLMKAEVTSWMV